MPGGRYQSRSLRGTLMLDLLYLGLGLAGFAGCLGFLTACGHM
jgi:hypothetical protein